jgi:hypothetical protein
MHPNVEGEMHLVGVEAEHQLQHRQSAIHSSQYAADWAYEMTGQW